MSSELTVRPVTELARSAWSDEKVAVVKNAVGDDLSPPEFEVFMEIAARYELDPLRGEIWPARIRGKFVPLVGRDGLLSIAQRHPDFRGWDGDVVREFDTFRKTTDPERPVVHEYELGGARLVEREGEDGKPRLARDLSEERRRGSPVGAWALVHRSGRRPTYFFAPWSEYTRGSGQTPWQSHPSAMILKAALANALRLAFNLSGLYAAVEFGAEEGQRRLDLTAVDEPGPDWGEGELGDWLEALAAAAARLDPGAYRPARLAMMLRGATDFEREALASSLEGFIAERGADPPPRGGEPVDAELAPDP